MYEIHCLQIEIHVYKSKSTKSTQMRPRLNIEIHKMYEIHLPKNPNPQHLGLHEIHGVTVEINTDLIWS